MEKSKKTLGLLTLALSALALTACPPKVDPDKCPPHDYGEWTVKTEATETRDGEKVATCKKCGKEKSEKISRLGFPYNVTFKDAEGNVISSETKRSIEKITKPADPTAPAGKVFYGWKNVKNGGQIWNFDDDTLAKPHDDIELVPFFVPANANKKILEAEFAPDIIANGGMDGSTYSGANKGKGLVISDENYEYGSTCDVDSFSYYVDSATRQEIITDTAPEGVSLRTMDPKGNSTGYFVHFNYIRGNTLTFKVNSSVAVDDAVIFARWSAEYGKIDSKTSDRYMRITDEMYTVSVNGTDLKYGTVTFHDIPAVGGFLPFQDFVVGTNVHLNAGENTIVMTVNNSEDLFSAVKCHAPCSDSIKIYSSSTITWPEASLVNIIK